MLGKLKLLASAAFVLWAGVTSALAQTTVKVAGFTWPSYGYWSIVENQKLSDKIKIEFRQIEDPYDSMSLLASGQLDVVLNTLEYAPIGASEGRPISVVAYYAVSKGADKIIVGPDIKAPTDLKGKTVGVLEGGLPEIFMAMWMDANGVDPKSVKKTNVIAEDVFAAMVGGSISAGVFWEPFASNVLKAREGTRLVANSADPEWLRSGVIADAIYMNKDFVAKNREAAEEFVRAYFAAIAWRNGKTAEGNKQIADALKMPIDDVNAVLGTGDTPGDLYVYGFKESARLCGAMEGEPPFGQTNGQIEQIWTTISNWWVRLERLKEAPASQVDCSLIASLAKSGFTGE
jgi:NitT/TauT family transport system substrate-binding protein